MLVEVQPEAEEAQTLVRAGHQQQQELLHDALQERGQNQMRGGGDAGFITSYYLLPGRSG